LLMPIHAPLLPHNCRMQWSFFFLWVFAQPLSLSSSQSLFLFLFPVVSVCLPYLPRANVNEGPFGNCISFWFSASLIFPPKLGLMCNENDHLVDSKLKCDLLVIFPILNTVIYFIQCKKNSLYFLLKCPDTTLITLTS